MPSQDSWGAGGVPGPLPRVLQSRADSSGLRVCSLPGLPAGTLRVPGQSCVPAHGAVGKIMTVIPALSKARGFHLASA